MVIPRCGHTHRIGTMKIDTKRIRVIHRMFMLQPGATSAAKRIDLVGASPPSCQGIAPGFPFGRGVGRSRCVALRTRRLERLAKPTRERPRLTDMEPAAEREGAPPQWLTHPRGKSIDPPYFCAH